MLDIVHKNFWRRLSGFGYDIFAREEVLAVGISLFFYGFLIEKEVKPDIQKEAS